MSIIHGIEYIGYIDPWDEERLSEEEVTRCRDCKHCVTTIWRECGSEWTEYECNLLRDFGGTPLTIALDGFCAWGERRDE